MWSDETLDVHRSKAYERFSKRDADGFLTRDTRLIKESMTLLKAVRSMRRGR